MELAKVIELLKARQERLRRLGVARLSVFGSVARSEATPESDVDLAVALDPKAGIDLVGFADLEREIEAILSTEAHLVSEPVRFNPALQAEIERDRVVAF